MTFAEWLKLAAGVILTAGGLFVFAVGADRTHQRFFGIEGCGFNGISYADSDEERRAGIEAVGCHAVKDKTDNFLVALSRHQNHRIPREGAAASGHVSIYFAAVPARNDVPPEGR